MYSKDVFFPCYVFTSTSSTGAHSEMWCDMVMPLVLIMSIILLLSVIIEL